MKKISTFLALWMIFACGTIWAQDEQKSIGDTQDAPLMETPEKPVSTDGALTAPVGDIAESAGPIAKVKWESKTHKFGTVQQNVPAICTFQFVNEGNAPLTINHVKPSCGCTATEWPKEPILPGESGEIKAEYNAKRVGNFTKSLTVKSNAEKPVQRLILRGKVVAKQTGTPIDSNGDGTTN